MKTMPAGEFKARCLRVMEDVKKYRTPVVITKKGQPVAKLVPMNTSAGGVFGCMAGTATIIGDVGALVLGADAWNAVGHFVKARGARRRSRRAIR